MRASTFTVVLDPSAGRPVFVQIADAIASDIARGRLRLGDPLPGSRTLATTLGVHRSTVVAAYAELAAQGWTAARPGGSTMVATSSPSVKTSALRPRAQGLPSLAAVPGYPVSAARYAISAGRSLPAGTLAMRGGSPDLRLLPVVQLARAYRRVLRGRGRSLLEYTDDAAGHPRLRAALADMLCAARGLTVRANDMLITRGSQMALELVARALVSPGDVVALESPGYPPALAVFGRAGARIALVPVDGDGIDVHALAQLAGKGAVRLVYVTPQHQYPTTVTLSGPRRLALLDLARRGAMAIVEDDYDHEFHFDGRPVLPLASADRHGQVIYVGSLAKVLAPGLRLGFVAAPGRTLLRMTQERTLIDRQGDSAIECAVAELLEDGEVLRHARRMRRIYHARRDALVAALQKHLGHAVSFISPAGGLALWAERIDGNDADAWLERSVARGAYFQTGRMFGSSAALSRYVRLGYAALDERELDLAVRAMARAL